ncbi:MAG: phospholipase C, phosphocholine-specific [Verrucomicrobiales bacterium]|nr:phospholipase C, phosphocholine-specific [Verrucomicrobiales bacterium]
MPDASTSYSRRDFLKSAAMLSGSLGSFASLPPSLARAAGIEPRKQSTFMDAKRVVILMQENRSFDHMFSTYRGVRGLRDPRAIRLADGDPVYAQKDAKGNPFVPFWLDIHGTNSTWIGSCPHDRHDQVAAGNGGKHDRWISAKHRGGINDLPLTMGYYDQRDIPFYHAFADTFTLCDQHFCSAIGPTTPNRTYLWSGTIREPGDPSKPARTTNPMLYRESQAAWTTFPERLEEAGISWKVYQNEISEPTGLANSHWLGNFTDNPLEWFTQYRVGHYPRCVAFLRLQAEELPRELKQIEDKLAGVEKEWTRLKEIAEKAKPAETRTEKPNSEAAKPGNGSATPDSETAKQNSEAARLDKERRELIAAREKTKSGIERLKARMAALEPLDGSAMTPMERALHAKGFTSNEGDPNFRKTVAVEHGSGKDKQTLRVPAGDILHQFRKDASEGVLPTVSWLVAPQEFSDHPTSAWFGAWYVSEVLDILTKDPEVWKDTIFLLTYDENDGFFDHIPPFTPPLSNDASTGAASEGLDTRDEFDGPGGQGIPIGLGYRVPLVIASPWSRGGFVNSEVFDHTSVLQFLEIFLAGKSKQPILETNISSWRRTVCGNLTSAFRVNDGVSQGGKRIEPAERDSFIAKIERAKSRELPKCPPLSTSQLADLRSNPLATPHLPQQEPGTRPACPLPYQLGADGIFEHATGRLLLSFSAADERFGRQSRGAPFTVYAPRGFRLEQPKKVAGPAGDEPQVFEKMRHWSFAVKVGDRLTYAWSVNDFPDKRYDLEVYGPNGFYREMRGGGTQPEPEVTCQEQENRQLLVRLKAPATASPPFEVVIETLSYRKERILKTLSSGEALQVSLSFADSAGWHDFQVTCPGNATFIRRYAGRIEDGRESTTDPMIGGPA